MQALGARPRQHVLQCQAVDREGLRRCSRGCSAGAALVSSDVSDQEVLRHRSMMAVSTPAAHANDGSAVGV